MRATDMIRSVLDLLDSLDDREPKIDISIDGIPQEEPPEEPRFASVLKMLSDKRPGEYGNSPNEVVALSSISSPSITYSGLRTLLGFNIDDVTTTSSALLESRSEDSSAFICVIIKLIAMRT